MRTDTFETIERDKDGLPTLIRFRNGQEIRFQNGPRGEVGVNGLTLDEVLAAASQFAYHAADQWPTPENEASSLAIRAAASTVEIRTKRRLAAGVEGTGAEEL